MIRFWLQLGVAVGVGVTAAVALGEAEGDGPPEGPADAVAIEAPAVGSVDEACSDLPLKAPAMAKPLRISAMTSRSAPPAKSRRRRYTAALGFRTAVEPDAGVLPRADESPCLPILLG